MREMISLGQIPPPPGAKKGHYAYVQGHPAPVWVEHGFDLWQFLTRTGIVVGALVGLATMAKTFGLL